MAKNSILLIAVIALVLIAGSIFAYNSSMEKKAMAEKEQQSKNQPQITENNNQDTQEPQTGGNTAMFHGAGTVLAGTKSPYLSFTKADYDKALAENRVILLYFYAEWCPACQAEQPLTFAAFDELQDENIVGFRVNYKDSQTDDDEVELAREFGITYQHTKVILKDGERVLKAPDSWDTARYLEEIAKYS